MSGSCAVRRTVLATTAVTAALFAGVSSSAAASVPGGPGVRLGPPGSAFYNPPKRLPPGKPGTLIWARAIQSPKGAQAWKVLYKSTVVSGAAVAVSGLVIAPKGNAPRGGRPVVAWAHGTLGGARNCAPSIPDNPARDLVNYYSYSSRYFLDVGVPALSQFLEAGYVVTATDYQGLGTPGVHQYVVGTTEAHNVLDSVKAAQQLSTSGTSNRVVLLGWSQGGGAAIFAGQSAASAYAKPLRVLGVAALAPAADTGPELAGLTPPGPTSSLSPSVTAVQQLNTFRGFAAAYPGLDVNDVVAQPGRQAFQALNIQCTVHLGDVIQELGTDPATMFKRPFPADWKQRFDENTAGNQTSVAPVLTMQGTADTVVNPNGTAQYIQRACRFRQPVTFSTYPGANHQTIPFVSQKQYVPWIADRFAGRRAPSNCSP